MIKYRPRAMFGAALFLCLLGYVACVTTNLEGRRTGGCDGPNRCIRASECRRSIRENQGGEREKVLFNCGFEGVSLLVCCPPEEQTSNEEMLNRAPSVAPSTTTTMRNNRPASGNRPASTTLTPYTEKTTETWQGAEVSSEQYAAVVTRPTSRPNVGPQRTTENNNKVPVTQRPSSTTLPPLLSERFPDFRPEIPVSQRSTTTSAQPIRHPKPTTPKVVQTQRTPASTMRSTTKSWELTTEKTVHVQHVTRGPSVPLSAQPFNYYNKPSETHEEYQPISQFTENIRNKPSIAPTESPYNSQPSYAVEVTTQQSRRPFEPPFIIDNLPKVPALTRPSARPPANMSPTFPGSNTVGSGESGHLWPTSQHVQQPPRQPSIQSVQSQQTHETQDISRHRNYRLLPQEICGTTAGGPNRIINGQNVTLGQFPWMALLGYKTSEAAEDFVSVCGGTLISWKYVLTAAHCLKNSVRVVRLGEHVITTQPDCDQDGLCADPVVDIEIELKIPHPSYGKPYLKNDIGLVRLRQAQPRLFSSYVRPICLPLEPEKQKPGRKLIIAGWGTTRRGSKFASDVLQMAVVPEIGLVECNDAQEDDVLKPVVASQMCAAVTDHHSTSCHGDSGGPLMDIQQSRSPLKQYDEPVVVQLGIVSVGSDDCGLHGAPSIYTRVSSFTNWILDTLQD